MYDAIVVLGGSVIDENTLPVWVINRLNYAIDQQNNCKWIILASRCTPHKPQTINKDGFVVDESQIMANYMMNNGIKPSKLLMESWSQDTIGNAYGVLCLHCIPRNIRSIHVVTSEFHMPRSQAIFKKVFSLHPSIKYELSFHETKSSLIISNKERNSLVSWREKSSQIHTLADLHSFIFTKHLAYCVKRENTIKSAETYSADDLKMYCV